MRYKNIAYMVLVFAALLVLWPNIVHEPLHYAALKMQGLDGHIAFDWGFPAHPSTTKEGQIASIEGGLLFLLLPSIASLAILCVLFMTRPNVWTHFVLGVYLVFDLIINVRGYAAPFSDFRFLQVLPPSSGVLIVCAGMAGALLVWKSLPRVVEYVGVQNA